MILFFKSDDYELSRNIVNMRGFTSIDFYFKLKSDFLLRKKPVIILNTITIEMMTAVNTILFIATPVIYIFLSFY